MLRRQSRLLPGLLFALLLSGAASSCAGPGPEGAMPAEEDWHLLPADFTKDYFFLPIQLKGEEARTLWFLFDTGSNVNLVDADSLAAVSSWTPNQGKRVNLSDATCGPMTIDNLSLRVRNLEHLKAALHHPFDGILGYGALADMLVQLDYPAGQMKVTPGILPKPDHQVIFPLDRENRPFVRIEFGGKARRLLLDSGSSSGFEFREGSGLDWEQDPIVVGTGMAIDGLEWNHAGRLAGEHPFLSQRFARPVVFLTKDTELVGTKVLREFTLIFDQATDRLYAQASQSSAQPAEDLLAYAVFFTPTPEGRRAIGIHPGSQAEADGWQIDDLLLMPEKSREEVEPGDWRDVRRGAEALRLPLRKEVLLSAGN